MESKSIKDLYDKDFDKLPTNVQFLKIEEKLKDDHLKIIKASNNTSDYYPQNFYKIISPIINLKNEF
ncbi:MAG TPA: hypothetical protein PLG05_10015 [Bacteroidales bacterium]|jgi:hypothetical protein|nr:hypothetical protein [Bacteroidales bacterium]OQC46527.1 MAG: hypothetical protein BWX59_00391 [Bacteroidetes bacterium ADurb.Bin028]HNY45107.1 hypothetical protein [Bacteroidales bacterium]HOD88191.1 hypothetical protein [Bacteroidales bacterium]HPL05496.1 hypothetical protein [Bacteroidales bacterium]